MSLAFSRINKSYWYFVTRVEEQRNEESRIKGFFFKRLKLLGAAFPFDLQIENSSKIRKAILVLGITHIYSTSLG